MFAAHTPLREHHMQVGDKRHAPADDAADGSVKLIGGTAFPEALQEQREAGDFCDAVVIAGGERFLAHRAVLAGTSPYFHGMYKSMMGDSHDEHTLPAISATSFAAVLGWMYKGRCVLDSNDDLVPVLEAANLLQLHPLRDRAAAAIAKRLTADSCVGAWDLAERLSLDALRDQAHTACLACWPELRAPEKLGAIGIERLVDLLGDDGLKVQAEGEVLDAIDAWIGAQPSAPSDEEVARLVAQVRFPLLSAEQSTQAASKPFMQGAAAMKAAFLALATDAATIRLYCRMELQKGAAPGEFVWTIANFSTLEKQKESPIFDYTGLRWRLRVFPKGNKSGHLAIYLVAVDAATRPCETRFSLRIPSATGKTVIKDANHKFDKKAIDWGFREVIPLTNVRDPTFGYLIDDKLTISVYIHPIHPKS